LGSAAKAREVNSASVKSKSDAGSSNERGVSSSASQRTDACHGPCVARVA
jgi:hypothetical protein